MDEWMEREKGLKIQGFRFPPSLICSEDINFITSYHPCLKEVKQIAILLVRISLLK